LVTLRRDFDGDLDMMLVLLTLSLGTRRENWVEALQAEAPATLPTGLTNTQSIALATGIPRESVRRKLETMRTKGWISRGADGNWAPEARAAQDLRASSGETLSFLRALMAAALSARPRPRPDATPRT